jgi:hypothetical protein
MKVVSNKKAAQLLLWFYRSKYSKFFTVVFKKRTDGTIRTMRCKLSQKYTKGGQLLYDLFQKRLICVMDVDKIEGFKAGTEKSCYRNINLDEIVSVAAEGEKYVVKEHTNYVLD